MDKQLADAEVLLEFCETDFDAYREELGAALSKLEKIIRSDEMRELLAGPHDSGNAIVVIHAGAGGTEAQDWAQMLLRMYIRYAESQGFKAQLLDTQFADDAGIKSATLSVEGPYAFGFFSAESGVHRLVRLSPFDANQRRHTSFASLFAYPDIEGDIEIEVLDKDLRVDTYRAGGAGGQHVNKTDSAVRLTHLPTGIVVQCQNERSQHQNRSAAMKILKARLYDLEIEKKKAEQSKVEATKKEIAWGSQIRSYTLHPYRLIKDHRTQKERTDVEAVLDGNIQSFIEATLLYRKGLSHG